MLSQIVIVCPGLAYNLLLYAGGECDPVGGCEFLLQACVGSTCVTFAPSTGAGPIGTVSMGFSGTTDGSSTVMVSISVANVAGSVVYCGRRNVRFDDISLTLSS